MDKVQKRLARCFSAVFPELVSEAILHAAPSTISRWDSLATATLLAVVEQEFGVEIDLEQLEGIVSFDQLLWFIRREKECPSREAS